MLSPDGAPLAFSKMHYARPQVLLNLGGCRCELDPTGLDIGAITYGQRQERHMILSNTSTTRAAFQFLPLPGVMFGDANDRVYRPAPRWASVSPQQVFPMRP